ncbi:MAG: hypothetical protein U1F18_05630 [Steroidobacteraceae bacterium]
MSTRSIGGPITAAGLGALLGERPDLADQHRDPTAWALRDAVDHARRSLSALRSIEAGAVRGDTHAAIGRYGALLVDLVAELERIERRGRA